jgi:DNA polymerase-3 subunit delta'
MAWEGIQGHDEVVAGFARAAARGRVAGGYLFIGDSGVGKATFAKRLARVLTCESSSSDFTACGRCSSCIQADAESHPDIDIVAKPEERATIPIEAFIGTPEHRMREGLCWRILLRPAIGQRKVAIILDADAISEEGANCLLKTLEEPPDAAVLILVGTALERQLPTIRSRCKVVRFRPLQPAVIEEVLAAEDLGDTSSRAAAAASAAGSLARARILVDPDVAGFRRTFVGLLAGLPFHGVDAAREITAIMEAAGKEATRRRPRLKLALELAIDFFHAALRMAATGLEPVDPLLARAATAWIAAGGTRERADECLQTTLDAFEAIDRNANLGMLIDAWTAAIERPRQGLLTR